MKINNTITDSVADTLYITLAMKCKETRRKKPFFSDPHSCDMIEKIDYDFSKYDKAIRSSIGVAIRANYFDKVEREFILNNPKPIIVHVGCGLDTRFLRLGKQITEKAFFYELDLPEVIEIREKLLPESKNNICISASMFETAWMDDLIKKHGNANFLFMVEGVFMYFEPEQVKSVVLNITQRFKNSVLVFDSVNSWMCRNSHRHDTVKLTKTSFKFPLDNPIGIEQWNTNIRLENVKLFSDFSEWRKAGLINNFIMKTIPVIRNASRMLTYKIN